MAKTKTQKVEIETKEENKVKKSKKKETPIEIDEIVPTSKKSKKGKNKPETKEIETEIKPIETKKGSRKKKQLDEDIIDAPNVSIDQFLKDDYLENEIQKTVTKNKDKHATNGDDITVNEASKSDKEMISLDDIKAHFLKVGKENDGIVKQEDIDKYTDHLELSDDDFNDILVYLNDNGLTLDSTEDIDEDELPPVFENDDFNSDEEDDEEFVEEEYEDEEMIPQGLDIKNSDPVRMYLHAIGSYQVFKGKDEEVKCAQAIIKGDEALKEIQPYLEEVYNEYLSSHPDCDFYRFVSEVLPSTEENTPEDFVTWFDENYPSVDNPRSFYGLKQYVDEGKEAKNLLIQCNLKLVVSIAKHYVNRGMDFLDLIQEGNLGLMKAVDKFDYTRGFKFSTYATWWIRQAITRALADQARTIRIPVHMVETINKITRAQRKLVQKLNRDPTAEEISEELNGLYSATRIREIQQIALDPLSLEKPVGEEEDSHVGDFIEDKDNESPYEYANRSMLSERIDEVLAQLTDKEARIIRLRYGLEDGRTHTLEEVGKEFNVTRERIRQIEAKSLKKLRHPTRAKMLKDFTNDL